jgi:phosphoglycerate dehydrogenase-like enzyme
MMPPQPTAAYLGRTDALQAVYGPEERAAIERLVRAAPLGEAEVLLGTWGLPLMDAEFFDRAPRLRAVFYAAGSVRGFVTPEAWDRGIRVVSAWEANAMPVAEYTVAAILFSLKWGWRFAAAMRGAISMPERQEAPGGYGSSVGLVSLGAVGRLVARRLRASDLRILAWDPTVQARDAWPLGIELVGLEELFERCDVVSLHTPLLPETRGSITGAHLASMKHGATLINTARGAVVREPEMIEVLCRRPDLQAVLDVTDPEPPDPESPLRSLPNVILTPLIAGPIGAERRRLGALVVRELRRYLRGQPLRWEITADRVTTMAMP